MCFSVEADLIAGVALSPVAALACVATLVPRLFGSPIADLRLFAPDAALGLIATAVSVVLWAPFRLGVAHNGRSGHA